MNKMKHDHHSVSMCLDHLVFCPKYRGKVLIGRVPEQAKRIIHQVCEGLGVEIIRMAVGLEHVHIFYRYPPSLSLSYIAKMIKGVTSRRLRQRFPWLKTFCPDHLWAPSCFHGSVGNGWDVVEAYIKKQEGTCQPI